MNDQLIGMQHGWPIPIGLYLDNPHPSQQLMGPKNKI